MKEMKPNREFVSFPKIAQFRQIIQDVEHMAHYIGHDEKGVAQFDPSLKNPVLHFYGTVKLHGSNAGVSYRKKDGIWAQSRSSVITPEQDNLGFAAFVENHQVAFEKLFESLAEHIRDENTILTIFGEWAGEKIQKGVAVCKLPRFYSIFAVKVSPDKESRFFLPPEKWEHLKDHAHRIYNVLEWKSWEIDIDFNAPAQITDTLNSIVEEVEKQCPVGKAFGVDGPGEGVVWVHHSEKYGTLRFKVKGEKHNVSRVRKKVEVDPEIQNSIDSFIEYAVTENRLNQALEVVFTQQGETIDIKKMGAFLSWVAKDIETEEMDVLLKSGLEIKQVNKAISEKARKWFMEKWKAV
jgi:hypothetical protein